MNVTTAEYRTDKVMNGYVPTYQALARAILAQVDPFDTGAAVDTLRVLEIGAGDGAGMEMFRSIFETSQVYGVDNEPTREVIPNVIVADQDDPALPSRVPGPWDVIVDDASHQGGPTSRTLAIMWPTLRPGGYYVIEDWNFYDAQGNAGCLWQMLFGDMLAYDYTGNRCAVTASGALSDVYSVTVRHGLIIVHKGGAEGES
jgi:hypothetical protein